MNKRTRRQAVAGRMALPFAAAAAQTRGSDEELLKVREAAWPLDSGR